MDKDWDALPNHYPTTRIKKLRKYLDPKTKLETFSKYFSSPETHAYFTPQKEMVFPNLRIGEMIELRCPFMVPRLNSYAY